MKLYLVQHGEAVSKDMDPDRPLSTRGETDVGNMGRFLALADVRAQKVLHSGKTRAEQTATILAEKLMPARPVEPVSGIAPNDPADAFVADLELWDQDTLVVGHLPFMARLVALLLCGDARREIVAYQPGSVVCLERDGSGNWCLNWMVRPELLLTS
jgi:phosphohistidine phosphatase